jgi:methionine-rich copper-binding protein CopC
VSTVPQPHPVSRRRLARSFGLAAAVFLAAALVAPGSVLAHAALETADPAPESTIPETPELVTAEFTDRLDPSLSSLTLSAPDGTVLTTGGVAPEDPEARQMVLRPPTLADGIYTVGWTAVSDDDKNVESGTYTFTVLTPTPPPIVPPTMVPTPTPTPASSAPPSSPSPAATASGPATPSSPASAEPSPPASPAPGGQGNGPGAEPIVGAIVLALVAAAAVGAVVAYRRRRGGGTA